MKPNNKLLKSELRHLKHLMGLKEESQKEKRTNKSKTPLTPEIKNNILSIIKSKNGKKINDEEIQSISDDLEDLKRRYTPEQLQKMWEYAHPKSSEISGKLIIGQD